MNERCCFWKELKNRWRNAMPKFFKRMMWLGYLISGTAIAVHEVFAHYDIQPDDWWLFIERYLIGGGVGIVFACKFTQTYDNDGKPIDSGRHQSGGTILDKDDN